WPCSTGRSATAALQTGSGVDGPGRRDEKLTAAPASFLVCRHGPATPRRCLEGTVGILSPGRRRAAVPGRAGGAAWLAVTVDCSATSNTVAGRERPADSPGVGGPLFLRRWRRCGYSRSRELRKAS